MAFGYKRKVLKTNGTYTVEELYEKIKDVSFEAGTPMLTKHGMTPVIVFPALDGQNQCTIWNAAFKAQSQKFQIMKFQKIGVGNMVTQEVLDQVTGGFSGLRFSFGGNAKKCEKQVVEVAEKLEQLGL